MFSEKTLDQNLQDWEAHSQENAFVSSPEVLIDCSGYRNIVAMGREAHGLLYKRIQEVPESHVLGHMGMLLVGSIAREAGDEFKVPKAIRGCIGEMRTYTTNWLAQRVQTTD